MEVLFASIVKPIPKKLSPVKSPKPLSLPSAKLPSLEQLLPRGLAIGLSTVTTTLLGDNLAKSLTYEEALGQTTNSEDSLTNGIDGIVQFATENPLIIGGAALALIVPLVLSQILQKPKSFGVVSAKSAYAKLSEESEAQLLDIREGKDIKLVGSPDIKATKKKAVSVTYNGDDKQGFLKKIGLRFKDPENTTLFILDKFDGNSELVAELVTANGFKAAYAIKDGAEGPRGWQSSGFPWTEPKKGFALDFSEIKDAFSGAFGETTDGLPVTVGLAVVTGLSALALSEIEIVLQLLGSLAIIQFASKKLLSAEDRKKTVQQLDEFLTTKVAPEELVDDIKMIGKALLPASSDEKSLPAPAATTPVAETPPATSPVAETPPATSPVAETPPATTPVAETSPATSPVAETPPATSPVAETPPASAEKTDVVAETKTEVNEDIPATATSTPVQVNATLSTPRPLSPYPYYPDFKPPSSPSPSQP
ncbi:rhodanese-like domain-containing protein 4 [Carex littledalei]|uniref:Protein THYLAKOID RHODANESE-LIKE, chloroplastic n=1 Tax=Carex littledalei TaxID=544730 RepID=A0A833R4J9_9POAL|nr:rhodanese-like domain-containing protein 4 [Carex littledalei]